MGGPVLLVWDGAKAGALFCVMYNQSLESSILALGASALDLGFLLTAYALTMSYKSVPLSVGVIPRVSPE